MRMRSIFTMVFCVLCSSLALYAQTDNQKTSKDGVSIKVAGREVKMSGLGFATYQDKSQDVFVTGAPSVHSHNTGFKLKRGYITLKSKLNDVFSVRYTQDITVDKEGKDAGNVETRVKYLYLKVTPKLNSKVFTGLWIEAGLAHTPWVDFEQKINPYRIQGTMFSDRSGLFSSADFGFTVGGNIGPKMDKDFLKRVSGAMQGRYLSYVVGVYNGGGYSSLEKNNNKIVQGRLSWRPLPTALPQLQVSACANYGKGNSDLNPDYIQYLGMLSYVSQHLTITAQAVTGKGDRRARYVDGIDPSKALDNDGYSAFAEYKFSSSFPLAIFARYDNFKVYNTETQVSKYFKDTERYIGGLAYTLTKGVRLVVDAEYEKNIEKEHFIYEVNLGFSF